jgi:hypothetical protein
MRDHEVLPFLMFIGLMVMLFIVPSLNTFNDDRPACDTEWRDCQPTDLVGDCVINQEEVIDGPYWNQTKKTVTTMKKLSCIKDMNCKCDI